MFSVTQWTSLICSYVLLHFICGCRGITLDDLFHFISSKAIIRSLLELLCSDKLAPVPDFLQPQSKKNFWHFYTFLFCLWLLKHIMQRSRTGAKNGTFVLPKKCCTALHEHAATQSQRFQFHATLAKFSFCEAGLHHPIRCPVIYMLAPPPLLFPLPFNCSLFPLSNSLPFSHLNYLYLFFYPYLTLICLSIIIIPWSLPACLPACLPAYLYVCMYVCIHPPIHPSCIWIWTFS